MGIIKAIYTPICDLDFSWDKHGDGTYQQSIETTNFRKAVEKALKCKTSYRDQ